MVRTSSPAAPVKSLQDAEFKQQLQELRQTDNLTNLFYLAYVYLILVGVIGAALLFYHYQKSAGLNWCWNVPVTLAAILLVGGCQHQLTSLAHDAAHHTLFKNRWWNELASDWLCLFPLFSNTHHYRLQHLAHHQFVNDPLRDPDVSQLQTSGHWLNFPVQRSQFLRTLLKQLWLPNLMRYILVRARYSSIPTEKNPYLPKGWKPSKLPVRVGLLYLLSLVGSLTALVLQGAQLLLAVLPPLAWLAVMVFYAALPERFYSRSRIHPVISPRVMTLMRMTFMTALFNGLAWLTLLVEPWAWLYFLLLWVTPILTSFSLYMVLRQLVQHGNGGRGWLTNTRIFFVNDLINFCVFPMGQDYHLPHHLFVTVPHYRLRQLHELLLEYPEYREQAVIVEGYFFSPHHPPIHPTVLDVLGEEYAAHNAEVPIDNSVLDAEKVEEKADILREGELEKPRRAS